MLTGTNAIRAIVAAVLPIMCAACLAGSLGGGPKEARISNGANRALLKKYKNLVDVENGYHPEGTGDEIAAYHRVYWITHNDAVVEFVEAFRKYESEAKGAVSEERFQEATESMLLAWFYKYGAAFRAISRAMPSPSLATGMEGIEEMRSYSKAKAFPLTSYARFRLVEMAAQD